VLPVIRRRAWAVALLLATAPSAGWAHGAPSGSVGWTFDAWVVVPCLVAIALYAAGRWHLALRRSAPAPRGQTACFLTGWLVTVLSLVSPLHAAGGRSFAAHMLEHELLMLAGAPLLVMGRPLPVFLWAWPRRLRRAWAAVSVSAWVRTPWRVLSHPVVATVTQAVVLWAWHAPALFGLALASEGWHIVQHLCFVASALFFWTAMLDDTRMRRAPMMAVACLFATALVSGALGALMAFSSSPWYAGYARLGLTPFGLTTVEDQQVAGLLMWIPGGVIHAAAALAVVGRMLSTQRMTTHAS
jgi:putative membrane protein